MPIARDRRHDPDREVSGTCIAASYLQKLRGPQQIDYRAHPALITIELGDKDVQGVPLKASQSRVAERLRFEREKSF